MTAQHMFWLLSLQTCLYMFPFVRKSNASEKLHLANSHFKLIITMIGAGIKITFWITILVLCQIVIFRLSGSDWYSRIIMYIFIFLHVTIHIYMYMYICKHRPKNAVA